MWNLLPPLGFQGLHPDKPVEIYMRHLPHWRQEGATYFITFRLADSLPQAKLDELADLKRNWEKQRGSRMALVSRLSSAPRSRCRLLGQTAQESRPTNAEDAELEDLGRQLQERIERWLDQGLGRCLLGQAVLAVHVTEAMHHFDHQRYELGSYVVMPNHVHAIVRPFGLESLEDLVVVGRNTARGVLIAT